MMALEENVAAAAAAAEQSPRVKKKAWSEEEDQALHRLVRRYGAENWRAIAAVMPGRNPKSCRLRWVQHLDPRVDVVRPFTEEEDAFIVHLHGIHGNRWSTIACHLRGRTDNAIKNRWNSVLSKRAVCAPLFPLSPGGAKGPSLSPACPQAPPQLFPLAPPAVAFAGDPMEECLELFPLAPMATSKKDDAAASAGKGMHIGADDPLTVLRLGPPPAMVVFDAVPLRAVRL